MVPVARLRVAALLTVLTAALMVVQSAGGLLWPGLYRDNAWARNQWPGNDFVTLVVAVPVLVAALALAVRGSERALLVWMGGLAYALYNDAFYLFGAAFNVFFLVYVAIFALSLYALILALMAVNVGELAGGFSPRAPARPIAGYMAFWATSLTVLWTALSLGFVFTGTLPQVVVASGHPTSIVFAVDLTLMVPAVALGGALLWRRRPWGFVLSVILNVKGFIYALALVGMGASTALARQPVSAGLTLFWGALALASFTAATTLLWHHRAVSTPASRARPPPPGLPVPARQEA